MSPNVSPNVDSMPKHISNSSSVTARMNETLCLLSSDTIFSFEVGGVINIFF